MFEDDEIWCPHCGDWVPADDYCHDEPNYCMYYEEMMEEEYE